jgi:hypothetical protein
VRYIGPQEIRGRKFWKEFFEWYRGRSDQFNPEEMSSHLLNLANTDDDGPLNCIFLSEEGFTHDLMPNPEMPSGFGRIEKTCRMLKNLSFDDIHVILTIRRQDGFLLSSYKHLVQRWREKETFGGWVFNNLDLNRLSWKPVINYIESTFGAQKLTILPSEMIKEDGFLKYLNASLAPARLEASRWVSGRHANPSLSDGAVDLARHVNEVIARIDRAEKINTAIAECGAMPSHRNGSIDSALAMLRMHLAELYGDENDEIRSTYFPQFGQDFCFS